MGQATDMTQQTFTFMGNDDIADIILHASDCVIYAAPSFSETIAESIRVNTEKLERPSQRIIIDASAE